jgi:site-specific recombinase XerD
MNNKFVSIYKTHITEFIEMKRSFGFKYVKESFILSHIDNLAEARKETSLGITKEFCDEWGLKRGNESIQYQHYRINVLARFSSYLHDLGIKSYIPVSLPIIYSQFIPYVYSKEEICSLFKAYDDLRIMKAHKKSVIFCMPVLVRFLYATGLRISEALDLKNSDVNLDENYLCIKDCKNSKKRLIPITESLSSVCRKYVKYRNRLPVKITDTTFFFISLNGHKINKGSVGQWHKKCLEKAGIHYVGRKQGPRIHDLRHTFAVHALASMVEAGIDIYTSLPILSGYLGHQSLESTNRYIRLTANMYPDLISDINTICLNVFPKINSNETD